MVHQLLKRIIRKIARRPQVLLNASGGAPQPKRPRDRTDELSNVMVSSSLEENLYLLKTTLGQNQDVIFRRFQLGLAEPVEAAVVYIDGMVDRIVLNENVMKPLMLESRQAGFKPCRKILLELVNKSALTVSNIKELHRFEDIVASILYGGVILLIDGQDASLEIIIKDWSTRGITEPEAEILVRGPREGFIETLRVNTTLIRRKLRSPNLIFEELYIGRVSHTWVNIAYLKGIVSPELVAEVKQRLQRIDIDGILESGYLEEFIEDNPYSPFPQVMHTERPDKVAAALLEGRVAIITDGTPVALVVPAELNTFMTAPEDYYEHYTLGTAVLLVRFTALVISLLLPSLYIAITTYHQEMIPTRLLISIAAAREGVPFPALFEALLMEFTFEVLREAGIRLPRAIGQAVSIVGALVIGQAGVQAGIVSPLMVIIVAFTGIASFVSPSYNLAIAMRLLRFPLMLLAGVLGLFGVMVGIIAMVIHLSGLRSFGVPYLSPVAPLHPADLKDVFFRVPWWAMSKRPTEVSKMNRRRVARGQKPSPPVSSSSGKERR